MNYRQKSTVVQSAIPRQPITPHTYPFPRNNTTQSQYQRAPVFQTGRSEEFNRTHLYGATQNPSVRHLQNSGIQQATGSPPHDMNKQSPLPPQQHNPTPGLYGAAPTSAVVSGPAGQQMPGASQSQVPGPTQGAPSVAAVQSQGQQQMVGRNQAAMANPYYAHRPPPQRSMQPMMQPMNPTMSPLSRPATPTNPAQIQQFYLASTGPFPSMPAAPQASIMVGPMPGFPQRNQYPSPQYGVQSSQPMFVSNAGTSYTTYQLPQAHFPYYQMLALQVQGRGGMNQIGQGAMVGEQKKSQKKIITTQDPDTGQDVIEQIMSSANTSSAATPTSVASNYKGTPPPETQQPHNEIAAQFAAQVAAVSTPAVGSKPLVPMSAITPLQEPYPPSPPAMMDYVEPPNVHAMDASNANDASVAATAVAALADEDVAGSSTVQMCPDLVCEAQHGDQENYDPDMAGVAALQDQGIAEDNNAGGSAKGKDQWSPINQEGRKQYDRQFLLNLARVPMSIRKPEGLPDLNIIKTSCQKVQGPGGMNQIGQTGMLGKQKKRQKKRQKKIITIQGSDTGQDITGQVMNSANTSSAATPTSVASNYKATHPPEEKRKQLMEELEEEGRKARRRSTGNIRFIGELFKLNMLLPAIMHDCINKLLKQGDEESLECLRRLLTTVGKDLDTEDNKKGTMAISSVQMMDSCFKTMEKIVKLKQTSSRVRFMLQDVIELRQNKWIPRRVENNPKTIDQIHKEAEKEAQEQHMILQQHIPLSSKRADDRRKGRGNVSSSLHGSDDGWQSKKSTVKMKPPIQMPSLSQVEPDTLQLGPSWTKGSGSNWGGGSKSSASDSKQNQSNRFQLLGETSQFETRRGNQRSATSSRDSSRGRSSNQYSSLRKTPSQGVPGADREEVLNPVKSMVGFSASEQRPPPSKEAIGGRLSLTKEAEAVLMGSSNISQEEFERRCRHIVNEFLNNEDPAEAIQCVRELACPKNVPKLVSEAINLGLERSSHARTLIAQLMVELVQKKVITVDHYTEGLQFLLEMAEDLALDIPNLWEFLGSMIAPMISKNLVSLQKLKAASQPCIESGTAGLLFRAVLKATVKDVGPQKVTELWKASEIQWSEILSPKEDVDAFLANGLEFLAASGAGASKPMESMRDKLLDLLTKDASNEELFDWIEANVSDKKDCQFIRALVTAVVESSIKRVEVPDHPVLEFDKFQLNKRSAVLQKYLDHTHHLEVQALYAIQALMNRLEHPQGVLWNIFSALYDDDIISEDSFMQWEHNEDPNEQEGRGVCLKSVASFFNWLKESEPGED